MIPTLQSCLAGNRKCFIKSNQRLLIVIVIRFNDTWTGHLFYQSMNLLLNDCISQSSICLCLYPFIHLLGRAFARRERASQQAELRLRTNWVMTVDTAIAVAESCSQLQSTNQNQMKLYDSLFFFYFCCD